MLAFAGDLANLCSLTGLLAALFGLYFAIRGVYPAGTRQPAGRCTARATGRGGWRVGRS